MKVTLITSALLGLAAVAAIASPGPCVVNASAAAAVPAVPVVAGPVPEAAAAQRLDGIRVSQATEPTKLNSTAAVAAASNILGPEIAPRATRVNVAQVRFSNDLVDRLPSGIVPQNLPAWVVTFEGLQLPYQGGASGYWTEVNVVVDANTGAEIEVFTTK
jgi:hypothetical protein